MGILHKLSALLLLLLNANAPHNLNAPCYNDTKEGVYTPFSLSKAKLSNLDLIILSTCTKSYLPALNLISASAT
jgi:hypothetical protein